MEHKQSKQNTNNGVTILRGLNLQHWGFQYRVHFHRTHLTASILIRSQIQFAPFYKSLLLFPSIVLYLATLRTFFTAAIISLKMSAFSIQQRFSLGLSYGEYFSPVSINCWPYLRGLQRFLDELSRTHAVIFLWVDDS